MKILYISKYAATQASGHPTRQYFFSRFLAGFGNDVKLVYSNSNGHKNNGVASYEKIIEGKGFLTVHKIKGPHITLGMNLRRIWSWFYFEYQLFINYHLFKEFRPDIIIVSSLSILTFVYGVVLKKRLNRPLVLEVRDLYPLTLKELGWSSKYNPAILILSIVEKYGYRNADLIISSLENANKYIDKLLDSSVNFKWIPTGIDVQFYKSQPDAESKEIIEKIRSLKSEGRFIVGYAGSIGKANALEAPLKLSLDPDFLNSQIHFICIGTGPLQEKYRELYSEGNITFLKSVSKQYLPVILKECDILINTWLKRDIYQYGVSPNKWIDYMFSGRPILLAFSGSTIIFDSADCGWQIPAEDSARLREEILRLRLMSGETLDIKGKNGREYLLSALNYNILAEDLQASLQNCINTYRSHAAEENVL